MRERSERRRLLEGLGVGRGGGVGGELKFKGKK